MENAVPRTSFKVPFRVRDWDLNLMALATPRIWSLVRLPLCLMFFSCGHNRHNRGRRAGGRVRPGEG